jgi:glucosamine-6-phosphate deaminase
MEIVNYPETTYEKLPVTIFEDASEGAISAAHEIAEIIRSKQREGRNAVLGLATGSSPINVYKELVRLHREET